ncbi:hypothetical protein [Clostridium sp.]|uniref:hypothetical protein n=1 Tax=Clostridium sp. TaxID=1506 RepID=UPI002850413F|nr:hypothetical protein [Clostridium sp.]MDR3598025.1 hypothetical protein [Clostridium sp.]
MLKKIHAKMVSTFGKDYCIYFNSIVMGLIFAFLSIDYKDNEARKVELVISLILILHGIGWLIKSYKVTKNK